MGNEVATASKGSVPALADTPAMQVDAGDLLTPHIYVAQYMSQAVQNGLVPAGSIFSATAADDPAPQVLSDGEQPVRIHALHWYKSKAYSPGPGEDLQLFEFDDPNAPPEATVGYNFLVYAPEVDQSLPCKLLIKGSSASAAQGIITVAVRRSAVTPMWEIAFDLTTVRKENKKGKFFVLRALPVEADAADVKHATALAEFVLPTIQAAQANRSTAVAATDQPDI